DFAWPYMNRGLALASAGRLEEARAAYDRALEKNPKFAEALVNRALVRLERNDLAGAKLDLDRAIALGRNEPGTLAALGEVLSRLGRREEADRLYAAELAKHPENPSLRLARAVLHLKSDPAAARADLEGVLARNPRNARALYLLARIEQPHDAKKALEL